MSINFNQTKIKKQFYPFAQIKPVCDIRIGILTIKEKWEHIINLQNNFNKTITIDANIVPTKRWWENNKNSFENTITANKINEDEDVKIINYAWQLFKYNDWALRKDFELITTNRVSEKIATTNTLINAKDIFVEKGAKVEHSVLNASTGPIYIAKNAEIMEGCLIRGPFSLGENSLVKMGATIYGATTIGPNCVVCGEIKNTILFGYSNKAHHGYLGDSVIGEWCNLGAGTSNSNIKNNCNDVEYLIDDIKLNAGQKGGLLMGDYSKSAINTSFNTGAVVGICCNVFTKGLTPKHIPNFSWGENDTIKYKIQNALNDINKWKELKGFSITENETKILTDICKIS